MVMGAVVPIAIGTCWAKAAAIACHRSQIHEQPYNWPLQKHAILEPAFLKYFLRGEELYLPIEL